jgi:hypothetical protein
VPLSPVRSPLEALPLSEAVLRDGVSLGQVHLSEVSQGGELGHATLASPPASR